LKPEGESCLVEVLDRLLNKGAVLNADLIISVAGIPMIGINLKAALASMETMLDYGLMEAWDRDTREWYARQKTNTPLEPGENALFKTFGYLWQSNGISGSWVPGIWYITDKRLILWRRSPGEKIFEIDLQRIDAIETREEIALSINRVELELRYNDNNTARIYISEPDNFIRSLEEVCKIPAKIEIPSKV
jgi:hypothetical protein